MTEFKYAPMFQLGEDTTEYYRIPGSEKLVSTSEFEGHKMLKVSPEALTLVAEQSFHDCEFMLRRAHNKQVAAILDDPEASENDSGQRVGLLVKHRQIDCKQLGNGRHHQHDKVNQAFVL